MLEAARHGDAVAVTRHNAVSDRLLLNSAPLVVAREYGFASWTKLKTEIDRRDALDSHDVTRLRALLASHPHLATDRIGNCCDHPRGASPLGYVAMLRYDTSQGSWRDVPDTAAMALALLDAGAPVNPGGLNLAVDGMHRRTDRVSPWALRTADPCGFRARRRRRQPG